jgi:hypothetical protein
MQFFCDLTFPSLIGKPKGKRRLGRPMGIREDNIKMDFSEAWSEGEDWIYPIHLASTVMNASHKCLVFSGHLSDYLTFTSN